MSDSHAGKVSIKDDVFVFRIDGARFDRMSLGRVASYMAHVAAIAGDGAVFHRMTKNTIQFVDGRKK